MSDAKTQFTVDPELYRGFLDDSMESLSALEPVFIDLEANPNNLEVIDNVFRPVHSIKGNAAFFNLIKTKNFSHRVETLLDKIRKKEITADHNVVELLLLGVDELKEILTRVSDGQEEVADEAHLEALGGRIDGAAKGVGVEQLCSRLSDQVTRMISMAQGAALEQNCPELMVEMKGLEEVNQQVTALLSSSQEDSQEGEEGPQNYFFKKTEVTTEILTLADLLSRPAAETSPEQSAQIKKVLDSLEDKVQDDPRAVVGSMFDDYQTLMSSAVGFDDLLRDLLADKLKHLKSQLLVKEDAAKDAPHGAVQKAKPSSEGTAAAGGQGRTMRISEEKVDDFMKYVGELVMISDSLDFLERKLDGTDSGRQIAKEFHGTNLAFRELSDQLQTSLLEIRKVPTRGLTQRIPRMVRDLSENLGKEIQVEIHGEEISIDKTLLEALGDPVTHLVRNCVDHGIEPPKVREDAGKARCGTVTIELKKKGEQIQFCIRDDGGGIDPEKILAKAKEKGLIRSQDPSSMERNEVLKFIFEPGFSTAAVVSDVSGRGVGLDVVRTNVESLNGTIDIDSEIGKGTEVILNLPANTTVVVVSCVLVGVGEGKFLIPLENIKELIRPETSALSTVQQDGEVLAIRDQLYPLLRIHDIFDIEPKTRKIEEGLVVLAEANHQEAAIFVDTVYGQQRVLIKELEGELADLEGISGAAVLGDHRIGIILDVARLLDAREEAAV